MRKNIFICIIFAVSISACTEELDKEINIETNSSLYDLSESEALTIAKTFHESVTSEPRTRDNNTAFGIKVHIGYTLLKKQELYQVKNSP